MVSKVFPLDPVLAAAENAPLGPPESPEERDAVLGAMAESDGGAAAVSHDDVVRKLTAARR